VADGLATDDVDVTVTCHAIGVASYGILGHVPLDFQLFNFSGYFRAAQTLDILRLYVVAYPVKNIEAYSLSVVTTYSMNFIIFLCVTLMCKLSSLSLVSPWHQILATSLCHCAV